MPRAGGVEQTGIVTELGEFRVVEATDSDTDALLAPRDDSARWLLARGIDQWQPGQVPFSWDRGDDYLAFVLWRAEDRVGTVTILWHDPVIWGEQPVPAGYIHNLIVARPYGGQGLGLGLLQWAEDYVAESGRSVARLDCGTRSSRLRALYESVGYGWVRDQQYPWLGPDLALVLYEKVLRDDRDRRQPSLWGRLRPGPDDRLTGTSRMLGDTGHEGAASAER